MEVPLEVVAEQLGQSSIRVTKDVYGHLMPRSRARAAEAMRTIFDDDVPVDSPDQFVALATSWATLEPTKLFLKPLTRTVVGRPGLDPGTLGVGPDHPSASVDIRITWSEYSPSPPTSSEMLSNLSVWLHHWLHSLGVDVSGDVKICGVDGLDIQVCFHSSGADREFETDDET